MNGKKTKPTGNEFSFLKERTVSKSLLAHIEINLRDSFAERINYHRREFEAKGKAALTEYLKTKYDYDAVSRLEPGVMPLLSVVTFSGFSGAPIQKSFLQTDFWRTKESIPSWKEGGKVGLENSTMKINGVFVAKGRTRTANLRGFEFRWHDDEYLPVPANLTSDHFANASEKCKVTLQKSTIGLSDNTDRYFVRVDDLLMDYNVASLKAPLFVEAWVVFREAADKILMEKQDALKAFFVVSDKYKKAEAMFSENPELWVFVDQKLKDALMDDSRNEAKAGSGTPDSTDYKAALKSAALRRLITK